jgi:LEA14-like dessication related protein
MKKAIKRIGIVILALVVIGGGAIYLFRKQLVKHFIPDVDQIGEIKINLKNDTSYISSKLVISNNTFLEIYIDTIKYKISLFDKTYLQNEKALGIHMRGHGKDTIDFGLKIPYVAILRDLKAQRKIKDSANYAVAVSLQYTTAFGRAEIPINKAARMKIPDPPELEVVDIKYEKVRFKYILADARIKITNHSIIDLSITDMSYNLNVLKQGNLKGNYREDIHIKPYGTTYINIPIKIDVDNMGKTFFQVIFNKDNYDYILTLNAVLQSTDPVQESVHIDLTQNGVMELKK